MSLLERLKEKDEWRQYYQYKEDAGNLSKENLKELFEFIEKEEYTETVGKILRGVSFQPPHKTCVNKLRSSKKRIVYTYSRKENYVLKMITFLLKEYDDIFSDNLYSFRKNKGVKSAMERLLQTKHLNQYFSYKVDISDYFNSIPIEKLIPIIEQVFVQDVRLAEFIKRLLLNPYIYENGVLKEEKKGIMAGTPIATFLANLYLIELDQWFEENEKLYSRYSDDIIVFALTEDEQLENIQIIQNMLKKYDLSVNHAKEVYTRPEERWTFLGFSYKDGKIDVSPVSIEKIKNKMRRKVKALKRWQRRNHITGENTAKAFIRHFNRSFFDNKKNNELTWTRWYFPIINSAEGIREIDKFMQDQIRYLATGTRTKARFDFRYEDMKKLGYRSLVSSYYNTIM